MSDYANDWVGQTLSGGRYRVDAKLGEGGMGFVYKVWDRNLDTDVVVKAPRKSMLDDPEFASRFALEIRSLVKLSHPNIVKVSDVGEHEGLPFAVMQYLAGGTLDERQDFDRNGRPLPASPGAVSGWLPGMAAALDFIHGKGYIHRDVKPANILFDTHGHPYLSDFGVAKVLSDVEASAKKGPSGMTGIGIVLGTPEYMAPELIMGNKFDGKVDQYALAATVYEILCGRKPFTGETATAILVRQTTQEPPPMVELSTSGAQAIAKVILKGMAKTPAGRFGTCVEFANALVAALATAGTARPSSDRLACPTCGVGFAATADLANFKGRKSKCRACGAPFRISEDGLTLLRLDPDALPTPSGSVHVPVSDQPPASSPRANRTVKLDAMPAPARVERTMKLDAIPNPSPSPARVAGTMKLDALPNPTPSPARAAGTMKLDAMPGPSQGRAAGTMKLEAMPNAATEEVDDLVILEDEAEPRSVLPWVIGAVAASAAAALVMIILATRPSKDTPVEIAAVATPNPAPVKRPKPPPQPQPPPPIQPSPEPAPPTPEKNPDPSPTAEAPPSTPPSSTVEVDRAPDRPPAKSQADFPTEPEKPDDAPRKVVRRPGQSKDLLTLRQLVEEPMDYLDQVVSPTEVLLVRTQVVDRGGLAVRSAKGGYRDFVKPGTDFEIVLKPELARYLGQELNKSALMIGEYPAMMGLKIEKGPGNNSFRGVVEWLEFLYYVDARPLDNGHNVAKALFVLGLASDGAGPRHSPRSKEWSVRLAPTKILPNVLNVYIKEGRPHPLYTEWAVKATKPDRNTVGYFHKWIYGHIH
jgi:serine/threonine protein kinase